MFTAATNVTINHLRSVNCYFYYVVLCFVSFYFSS
jgi:hypothetical protein